MISNPRMFNSEHHLVESISPALTLVQEIPLFAKLDRHGLAQITRGLKIKHVAQGEYLFHQGSDADSAFFVQCGSLDIISALPGGNDVHLTKLGPGSMTGETALITTGLRTASIRAETDETGFSMERRFFQASLEQASPAAALILAQLTHIVSNRLKAQYAQIIALESRNST